MATFGEFSVAYLGMVASQLGLNVTGQNISNINTPGYTRQQLDQYSFVANGSGLYRPTSPAAVGQGALVSGVSQLRDPYLDIRFRKEMSGVASADATLGGLEQILSVIDDVEKAGGVTPALQALRDAFANLSSDKVNEKEFDTLVRSAAQELCQILNLNASKLEEAYDNVMSSYKEDIKGVNQTLQQIQELTEKIRVADINGDQALELRDSRNQLIDELSQYMKIDVTYGTEQIAPGFEVEKITIKMVNNDTGKPDKTLIDGISRATVSLEETIDGEPNDQLLLSIGELYDTKGNRTSNTNSSYKVSGLTFEDGALSGQQSITISYTLGNRTVDVPITFEVVAPGLDATDQDIANAKAATLTNLENALETALGADFDIESTSSGITFTSDDTGADAATITSINTAGSGISFSSAQKTDAVKSNQGVIEEGMGFGALESTRQILTGAGEFSDNGTVTGTRGIPYYMKSLDMLANKLATTLNSINTVDKDGNKLQSIDAATGLPIDNPKAGNLFVAEIGNGVQNENATITAANIAISNAWASGDVQVVAAINTDPNASTQNDNLSRFINAFTEQYSYNPLEISRQDGTTYQATNLHQNATDIPAGENLGIKITYLDGMNQEHTVIVPFMTTGDAGNTQTAIYQAIQNAIDDPQNPLSEAGLAIKQDANGSYLGIETDSNGTNLGGLVLNMEFVDPANNNAPIDSTDLSFQQGEYTTADGTVINNGNIYTGSFEGCYANTEAILGTAYSTTSTVYETYATSADTLNNSRDGVMGVDLNEEGINLMTYQRAFAAACRLMTTLDEAMNTVINGMGVVGR